MRGTELTPSHHQRRILYVDDDKLSLFVNATILRKEGYELLTCSDPVHAVSIATSEEVDVAIFDYEMPEMNGAEIAALCKAAKPDLKVILFSGSLTIPDRELAFADLFVEKAGCVEILLDAIKSLLAESRTQHLRFEHLQQR